MVLLNKVLSWQVTGNRLTRDDSLPQVVFSSGWRRAITGVTDVNAANTPRGRYSLDYVLPIRGIVDPRTWWVPKIGCHCPLTFQYTGRCIVIDDTTGIYTRVSGTAPHCIFNIEWRAGYIASDARANFAVRLYESQPKFEIIYSTIHQRGYGAPVGVQQGMGTRFTQYSCNTQSLQPGLRLTFDQGSGPGGTAPALPRLPS